MSELYVVVFPSVNVRSQPVIANNVIGSLSQGQQVELVENVREVLPTGYVFRRMAGATEKWVAEINNATGQRLLSPVAAPAPTPTPPPANSETYVVSDEFVNVRPAPTTSTIVLRRISRGTEVNVLAGLSQISSTGWLFRRIAGITAEEWVAEKNINTSEVLLTLKPTIVTPPTPVPDPTPIPVPDPPPTPPPTPPTPPELYTVIGDFVNVRSAPTTSSTVLRQIAKGTEVAVMSNIQQLSSTGWLYRRLASTPEEWVAELNQPTGERLLAKKTAPTPIPTPTPTPPPTGNTQALVVAIAQMNVRSAPNFTSTIVRRITLGTEVTVHATITKTTNKGWVFRKIVSPNEEWVAEFNQQTGERLLRVKGTGVTGRVQTDGMRFLLDGKPFRFVGANMRELAFYGQGVNIIQFTNLGHRQAQMDAMKSMGMRVVRLHACHKDVPLDRSLMLVKATLDFMHSFGVLAIVCLNDGLGASEFYTPGDQPFHAFGHPEGHLDKSYFLTNAYNQNYIPFVRRMVASLKDHPAIFAWELGNEYAIHPQPATQADGDAFVRFAHSTAALIRSLDPNHLITTGLINVNQVAPTGGDFQVRLRDFALRLYGSPDIDFATVHFYQDHTNANAADAFEEELSRIDLGALKTLNKPLIVEEFGSTVGNRGGFTTSKLDQWFAAGAGGFMQWALCATGQDIGVGDNLRGMDNYSSANNGSYQGLLAIYKDWASRL